MKKVVDERVASVRDRIMKEAAFLLFILLIISIFVQSIILDLEPSAYLSEGILFIIMSAYITLRYIMTGTLHYETGLVESGSVLSKKAKLLINVCSGLTFYIVITGIKLYGARENLSSSTIVDILVDSFFTTLAFMFIMFIFTSLSKRRLKKIDHDLDKSENEI